MVGSPVRGFVGRHQLGCYFTLAYALAWADWVPMALSGRRIGMDPGGPTHFLGLMAPLIAAFAIALMTGGPAAARELAARMIRFPKGVVVWLGIASPVLFFLVALAIGAIVGKPTPALEDFGRFGGAPRVGAAAVWLILFGWGGFGEEVGWRGFALPALQRRRSPLVAAILLGIVWAGWHAPLFFVIESYRTLGPTMLAGPFTLGITAGSVVLAWLYARSGGSLLAVALWHGTYNFFSGTLAARGLIAAIVSTAVMIWAAVLIVLEIRARRRQRPSVIGLAGPRCGSSAPRPTFSRASGAAISRR
jgi:membrane protease YdiL (CAAX protease family)